ncbi:MAG TPA: NAD(+)/NADH kinase [Thermoleophilaceae bacterium]
MKPPRTVTLLTHQNVAETSASVHRVIDELIAAGMEVRADTDEVEKHGLSAREGLTLGAEPAEDGTELAVVLGGDGTMLRAMRMFAGRDVPVFSFNYGAIGFLATVEKDDLDEGIRRVIEGDYELLPMPALSIEAGGSEHLGVNDISFHRRANNRVAELAFSVGDDQLGSVRCDGLVVSTPVGSTGYNLANGGPVLAWGVEGYVVSFIAPHTLTARALVVATDAVLSVQNGSENEPVDVTTDGRIVCALEPQAEMDIRFHHDKVLLAQRPGSNFYHRLREKFGRLAY